MGRKILSALISGLGIYLIIISGPGWLRLDFTLQWFGWAALVVVGRMLIGWADDIWEGRL